MTGATLHDELMREAGFETDHHQELVRRLATRQRIGRVVAPVAGGLSFISGLLLLSAHVPRGVGLTLAVLPLVVLLCSLLLSRKGGD